MRIPSPRTGHNPPDALDVVRVRHYVLVSVLAVVGFWITAAITRGTVFLETFTGLVLSTAALIFSTVGWVVWITIWRGLSLRALFGRPPKSVWAWTLVATGAVAAYLAARADVTMIMPFLEQNAPTWLADFYTLSRRQPTENKSISFVLRAVLVGLVFAGVFEEILFRGVIFQRWAHAWNRPVGALLASSVLFASLHGFTLNAFAYALIATLIYVRTRSLWAPVALHMLLNSISILDLDPVEMVLAPIGLGAYQEYGWTCLVLSLILTGGIVWRCSGALHKPLPYSANIDGPK